MEHSFTALTQNQKLLWIGQELNPESPMYNMVMTYEIEDGISVDCFKKAFKKLVENSDALRSVFELKNGTPVQRYLPKMDGGVAFVNFSNNANPKEAYAAWEKERVKMLFDVKKCLFDVALVKLAARHFIFYANLHHLITDGWSTTILLNRMSDLYAKAQQNKLNTVEQYPSFQEFASYHQNLVEQGQNKAAAKHWEEKQKAFPSVPALYHIKNVLLGTASKRLHVKLGKARTEKTRALANTKGIRGWSLELTLYNLFLTAFFAYVYRVSGQEKLVIGSPTHNRTTKKFKNTLGFFVETFPLATHAEEGETFFSLFKKVQLESNGFLKMAQLGTSTAALNRGFNVFFNYINAYNSSFNGAPVKSTWVHPGHTDPRHHIRFHVHDFDNTGEMQLYFDLNTKVFNAKKQQEIPQHFLKLFDAFIENPHKQIDAVKLITDTEVSAIQKWNDTTVDYPENETLLSKFKQQALKTPDSVALIFNDKTLTYRMLDEKSNQVAHFLTQKGIQKNDIVVVSLDRSLEMVVYIYGIIKSGAAYLPVDTNTPMERLKFIVKDAGAKVLFYNHKNLEDASLKNTACFHVENIETQIYSLNTGPNEIEPLPEDLAYVIYTSGSTGQPKGVKCHHQGICNRLNWMNSDYPITSNDTLLQKTPITFDVSLWELFWPLQVGATLVIEIPEGHKNPDKLIATIKHHQITNIHFVPSMLHVFSQTHGVENCNSLNRIFCSGEALSVAVIEKTYAKLDVEVHNLYGPTEASVDVSSWYCEKNKLSAGIPIGKPVANTQLYILDKNLNQLPIGLKGELYIAGKQVAKGYLNRETLTKERFVNDIFSKNANAKMYKTGDLARYRTDGNIEYHGRLDNQVKIRGLRIELGEIEKCMEKHKGISQAIVLVDKQDNLVAYFTGEHIEDSEIINTLVQQLPDYMIPLFYVHLERFELLSSGKVNRKNLPQDHIVTKSQKGEVKIKPQNDIEAVILDVWKEVMNTEKIGVTDSFIKIGGNSLNAISITSRLRAVLELDVSIIDVFNYPTVRAYAKHVEETITKLLNEE